VPDPAFDGVTDGTDGTYATLRGPRPATTSLWQPRAPDPMARRLRTDSRPRCLHLSPLRAHLSPLRLRTDHRKQGRIETRRGDKCPGRGDKWPGTGDTWAGGRASGPGSAVIGAATGANARNGPLTFLAVAPDHVAAAATWLASTAGRARKPHQPHQPRTSQCHAVAHPHAAAISPVTRLCIDRCDATSGLQHDHSIRTPLR
jgi:hypothetical protein